VFSDKHVVALDLSPGYSDNQFFTGERKDSMDYQKLFHVLVVGGAMIATSGCASSNSKVNEAPPAEAREKKTELNCDEICSGSPDHGMMCPDEATGGTNCCWLMSGDRHPCCPDRNLTE